MSLTVPPYAGQDQSWYIQVPAQIAYKQVWEDGPWSMIPYAQLYPPNPPEPPLAQAYVPPPIYRTELWRANQTFPL